MEGTKVLDSRKRLVNKKEVRNDFIVLIILVCVGLFISKRNYLLFNSSIGIFSSIISYNILIKSLNFNKTQCTGNILLIGVAYGFIGGFDLLHTLAYEDMKIFGSFDTNIVKQLWMVARYLESITWLMFVLFYNKRYKLKSLIYMYGVLSVILLLIFRWSIFPDNNRGFDFTPFQIISEYVLYSVSLCILYFLYKNRKKITCLSYKLIMFAVAVTFASEILLSQYTRVDDLINITAHILKLFALYLVFRGINILYTRESYNMLFDDKHQLKLKPTKYYNNSKKLKDAISEKEMQDKETISNQNLLELILESVEEGIVLVSTKHKKRVLHWNDKFLKIWNMPKELIQEGDVDEMLLYVKDQLKDPEEFISNTYIMFNNRESTFHILEFKDGRILERYSNPLVVNGEIIGKGISFRDITQSKKAEEIKKENEINKKLLKEERKYDQLKTQFFTNLSHELKTPINVLLGNVQLLKVYLDSNSMDANYKKISKYLNSMWQNSYRLLRLINNLTDIVKIDSGYFDIALKNYNIVSVVEEITLSVADYIENMGINLIFDTGTEEKIIACDPDKIERILLNLLSNAVKFTDRGGRIFVTLNVTEDKVKLSVKDTGIGIPLDKQSQIFDRFKKASEDLVRNYHGTGIGLSLVKSLVEMHEGTIELKSNYGDGSEFIIELPSKTVPQTNETPIKVYMENQDYNIEKLNIEFSDIYS